MRTLEMVDYEIGKVRGEYLVQSEELENQIKELKKRIDTLKKETEKKKNPLLEERVSIRKSQTYLIDCDADPKLNTFSNLTVAEHKKGGQIQFDQKTFRLFSDPEGKITLSDLRQQLLKDGKSIPNIKVLEFLSDNQDLIPDELKGKNIYFLGTTYRNPQGELEVRGIYGDFHNTTRYLSSRIFDCYVVIMDD